MLGISGIKQISQMGRCTSEVFCFQDPIGATLGNELKDFPSLH